jgi:hypothetical protein
MHKRRKMVTSLAVTSGLVALVSGGCQAETADIDAEEQVEQEVEPSASITDAEQVSSQADDEFVISEAPAPFLTIEFEDGGALEFVDLPNSERRASVGVAEISVTGSMPRIPAAGLQDATAMEIFNAFAEPGTAAPEPLLLASTDAVGEERGVQGWARGMEPPPQPLSGDIACNDSWFQDWADTSLASDLFRLNEDGTTSPFTTYCDYSIPAFSGCSSCFNALRAKYAATVYNKDRWRANTCMDSYSKSAHYYACSSGSGYLYARAYYRYRDANNNGWYTAYATPANHWSGNRTTSWYWNGTDWDWRHEIRGAPVDVSEAGGLDEFDVFTGWQ